MISTCNRTELYGYAEHPFQLIQLLCENSNGSVDDFQKVGYVTKNKEAVHHLFEVGTGLDSQILGDFEIIGQIKQAFNLSRDKGLANAFLERLRILLLNASSVSRTRRRFLQGQPQYLYGGAIYYAEYT